MGKYGTLGGNQSFGLLFNYNILTAPWVELLASTWYLVRSKEDAVYAGGGKSFLFFFFKMRIDEAYAAVRSKIMNLIHYLILEGPKLYSHKRRNNGWLLWICESMLKKNDDWNGGQFPPCLHYEKSSHNKLYCSKVIKYPPDYTNKPSHREMAKARVLCQVHLQSWLMSSTHIC